MPLGIVGPVGEPDATDVHGGVSGVEELDELAAVAHRRIGQPLVNSQEP